MTTRGADEALADGTDSDSDFQECQEWIEPEPEPQHGVATGAVDSAGMMANEVARASPALPPQLVIECADDASAGTGGEAASDTVDHVRRRAIVDRALGQLFETVDSLASARMLFSRYDRAPKNGELDIRALRAMLQHLGKGQWEYSKSDARNVLAALAPGKDSLPFAAFQREIKLCLLEALRRRWLAQSFSVQQEGQDWTRLWVLFTKHRSTARTASSSSSPRRRTVSPARQTRATTPKQRAGPVPPTDSVAAQATDISRAFLNEAIERLCSKLTSKRQAREAFRKIDKDSSGELDIGEFKLALRNLQLHLNERQIGVLMKHLDKDGDGTICIEEFLRVVFEGQLKKLRKKFQAAAYAIGGIDIEKLFRHYDKDSSGDIEFEEFRQAVRKDVRMTIHDVSDEELQETFDHVGNCGSIGLDEFKALLHVDDGAVNRERHDSVPGQVFSKMLDYADKKHANVLNVFHRFDKDSSGGLDPREFQQALLELEIVLTADELQQVMDELDRDGDGYISTKEFADRLRLAKRHRYATTRYKQECEWAALEAEKKARIAAARSLQSEPASNSQFVGPEDDAAGTLSGTSSVERLTFEQFAAAARRAGFSAHRGQRRTLPSTVCGMASNLKDSELRSLFALLVQVVQGSMIQPSLADVDPRSPTTGGLTFEGFLFFMECGCLGANQDRAMSPILAQQGQCPSPAARSGRWAHTTRELHPHADRVFEKLLKLKSASLRVALLPPDVVADPTRTAPRLSPQEFAQRLAVVGVELTKEELRILVAEFSTHNLVGSNDDTINVIDFFTRCSAYRRQHHAHATHQRNVVRQRLGQTPPSTPTSSSTGAAPTTINGSSAAGAYWSSSSDEGFTYPVSLSVPQPEPELQPKHDHYAEPELEDTLDIPSNLYAEPQRPWSPAGPRSVNPQDRLTLTPPLRRKPVTATASTFASPTISSTQKKSKRRSNPSKSTPGVNYGNGIGSSSATRLVDNEASLLDSVYRQGSSRLRAELGVLRTELNESVAALEYKWEAVDSTLGAGLQSPEQKQKILLRKELAAVKAQLSATKSALADSKAEVHLLRSHATQRKATSETERQCSDGVQPETTRPTTDSESVSSWTESDVAMFCVNTEEDGLHGTSTRLGNAHLRQSDSSHQQKGGMAAGRIPFSRQRSEYRSYMPDETSHKLQVKQWADALRASPSPSVSSSNGNGNITTRVEPATRLNKSTHVKPLGAQFDSDTIVSHEIPCGHAEDERHSDVTMSDVRVSWTSEFLVGDTEMDSDSTSVESDSDNTSVEGDSDETASDFLRSVPGLDLDWVPRTGMILRARNSVIVRSDFDLSSKHIGTLQQDDAIEALEVRRNEATCQYCVRIAVVLHDSTGSAQPPIDGWVNMTSSKGTQVLFSRLLR